MIQIEKRMGKALPLITLLSAGSIHELLDVLETPVTKHSTMVTLQPYGPNPPFYVVPGIGGNVIGLIELAKAFGNEQPSIGFQSVGLDGIQEPLASIETIAAHNLLSFPRCNQNFVLFGVCWGASVASEMAQQLAIAGLPVPLLILMDPTINEEQSKIKPQGMIKSRFKFVLNRLKLYADELKQLKGKEIGTWIKQKCSLLSSIVKKRDLFSGDTTEFNQRRVKDTNLQAMLNYKTKPYDGKTILLFSARDGVTPNHDTRQEWFNLLSNYEVEYVAGKDSGDAMSAENVQILAQLLKQHSFGAFSDSHSASTLKPKPIESV
jgi:thioesterase domain-containing protein